MPNQHIKLVKEFLGLLASNSPSPLALDLLSEDVKYEWLLNQETPVKRSLSGRAQVKDYLSILPSTYQILESDEQCVLPRLNKVVVHGGERARVVRTEQTVQSDWAAVFEFHSGRINHIIMTVYKMVVLKAESESAHRRAA